MLGLRVLIPVSVLLACALAAVAEHAERAQFAVKPAPVPPHPAPCSIQSLGRGLESGDAWPAGVVPYIFDPSVTPDNELRAQEAMAEIESVSPIRFVERSTETAFLRIISSDRNSSFVGMIGGDQPVWITSWLSRFVIVHELMHALGAWHEQQRPDQDQFVQIHWENIPSEHWHNFEPVAGAATLGDYDFESVMHYSECDFSVCCSPSCRSITVLPPYEHLQSTIGQRSYLSTGDVDFLNHRYSASLVRNLDDGSEWASINEAITAAQNNDTLLSPDVQFTLESVLDFQGKSVTLMSDGAVVRPSGSTTSLADSAALCAAAGMGITLSGQMLVPDMATSSLIAADIVLDSTSEIALGAGAGLQVSAASISASGDLLLGSGAVLDASLLTDFALEVSGLLDLAGTSLALLPDGAILDGQVVLAEGATMQMNGGLLLAEGGSLRIEDAPSASSSAAVSATGELILDGSVLVDPGASLLLDVGELVSSSVAALEIADTANIEIRSTLGATLLSDLTLRSGSSALVFGDLTLGDPVLGRTLQSITFVDPVANPAGIAVGDMNGDGDADVLVSSSGGDALQLRENDGAGTPAFTTREIASVNGPNGVAAADIDADGDLDCVTAVGGDGQIIWLENAFGDASVFIEHVVSSIAPGALCVRVADIDGDSDADIVGSSLGDSAIRWFESDGAASPQFTAHVITMAAPGAVDLEVGDIDNDGDMDVVAALRDGDSVVWYQNDGLSPPAFITHTIDGIATSPYDVAVADLDKDGDLDVLAAAQTFFATIPLYENLGGLTPSFSLRDAGASLERSARITVTDFNKDGIEDIVYAARDDSGGFFPTDPSDVIALIGQEGAPLQYAPRVIGSVLGDVGEMTTGDLNADAESDVVFSAAYENVVRSLVQRLTRTELQSNARLDAESVTVRADLLLGAGAVVEVDSLRVESGLLGGALDAEIVIGQSLEVGPGVVPHAAMRDASIVAPGGQTVQIEAFSLDAGAYPGPDSLLTTTISPLASLRVTAGAVVDVVDLVENTGDGAAADALYIGNLVVESGATLRTNGVPVYYETLTLDGAVDDFRFVAPIRPCRSDLTLDGVVDAADLAMLLAFWFETAPVADIVEEPIVKGNDLATILGAWGQCD